MSTVVITGANRGIGLALARAFSQRGDEVIATCRSASEALQALPNVQVEAGVDVADADSLHALAQRLDGRKIDVLICNAGVLSRETLDGLDAEALDAMRHQFEVNTLGPLRTVAALQARLGAGSKVGIITSRMGSVADNGSGGYYGYRASKAAVNAVGKSLANDLADRDIAVLLLHPGFVATDMVGGQGDISPADAAAQLVQRLDTLGMAQTGSFHHANGQPLPW